MGRSITRHLNDDAILLEPTGEDKFRAYEYGESASEIKVRWLAEQSEVLDPQGKTIKVDATAIVTQDIAIGSLMALGTMVDCGAFYQAVSFRRRTNVRGRDQKRTVGLMRYRDYGSDSVPGGRALTPDDDYGTALTDDAGTLMLVAG